MTRTKLRHRRGLRASQAIAPGPSKPARAGGDDAFRAAAAAGTDDELLQRTRAHWQQGDWQRLAETPLQAVQSHPQRARLALLIAAGHQQLGRASEARRCAAQALDWGCDKRAVAQVLISGVHGTLARAAALAGDPGRTRRHLEAALSLAYPGQDMRGLIEQRLSLLQDGLALAQQRQLSLTTPPAADSLQPETMAATAAGTPGGVQVGPETEAARDNPPPSPGDSDMPASHAPADDSDSEPDTPATSGLGASAPTGLPPGVATHVKRTMNSVRRLQQEMTELRTEFDAGLRQVLKQQAQLIESFVAISRAVDGRAPLPALQGWAVSADLGAFLMQLAGSRQHDAVIEFGSGSSTVLIALGLAGRRARGETVPHLAFEHTAEHQAATQALLDQHVPGSASQVVLAPLRGWPAAAGTPPKTPADATPQAEPAVFYDCQTALAQLAASLPGEPRILVLVDGPPAATGPLARYPALPTLLAGLAHAQLDIVVDDYGRKDDRAVVDRWQAELGQTGRRFTLDELSFVKAACRLRLSAPA
jgi:hypothetical protein